jgi:hypothetical protein
LELAIKNNWNNVLIVEDDATWNLCGRDFNNIIKPFFEKGFDVLMLGATYVVNGKDDKIISAQTSTAYLVNKHYFKILLKNFKDGLEFLQLPYGDVTKYSLDQYWKNLMKVDNWKCIKPSIMIQQNDYSDILKQNVDYRHAFI